MNTIEEARRYERNHPGRIKIRREVRYFARLDGTEYPLFHDQMIEELDRDIWMKKEQLEISKLLHESNEAMSDKEWKQ